MRAVFVENKKNYATFETKSNKLSLFFVLRMTGKLKCSYFFFQLIRRRKNISFDGEFFLEIIDITIWTKQEQKKQTDQKMTKNDQKWPKNCVVFGRATPSKLVI